MKRGVGDWSKVEEAADGEWRTQEFTIESTTMVYNAPAPAAPTPAAVAASPAPTDGGAGQAAHTPPAAPPAAPAADQAPVEFATPPPDAEGQRQTF